MVRLFGDIVLVDLDLGDTAFYILKMLARRAGLHFEGFLFLDQCLAVVDRDLIVVRMNFAESQKAVAVATEIDKSCLQGRFYPRDFREIDVAFDLFFESCLDIVFIETGTGCDDDPNLFGMRAIDKHALRHSISPARRHLRRANDRSKMCRTIKPGRAIVDLQNGASPIGIPPRQGLTWFAGSRICAGPDLGSIYRRREAQPFRHFAQIFKTRIFAPNSRGPQYAESVSAPPTDVRNDRIDLSPRLYNLY